MLMAKLSLTQYRQNVCHLLNQRTPSDVLTNTDFWTFAQAEAIFPLLWSKLTLAQKEIVTPILIHPMDERIFATDALRMKNATARVLRVFNENNIPVICMRGVAVSETLYPQSYLRPHTDIDVLFDKKHLLMAKQIVGNQLHYRPLPAYPMLFKQGDIPLDLHIEAIGSERIKAWQHITPLQAKDFFKYAEDGKLAGEKALLVHPRVMLPYLCFHALKHSFERLIWIYDIALLAKQVGQKEQWDQVLEGIAEYKLERPCYYTLSYAKEHLQAPVPDHVLQHIKPNMGFIESKLFKRFMHHEVIPYLAERLFSRMLPSLSHRIDFWRETIYPREEVRAQVAGGGCVKCNFIRTRIKQISKALWSFTKEIFLIARA